jgi:hypothetical protein
MLEPNKPRLFHIPEQGTERRALAKKLASYDIRLLHPLAASNHHFQKGSRFLRAFANAAFAVADA